MDRQALIAAAIAYARSNEDTPATKNLAELHARMAISLLTGEIGMYDPSFLSEDAEKVAFFDQVPAAPVVGQTFTYEPMTPEEIAARMVEIDAETEANRIARGVSDFIIQHADENDVLRLLARAPNGIYVDSSTPKSIYPTLRYDILNRAWATGIEHEEHNYQVRTFVINEHGLERLRAVDAEIAKLPAIEGVHSHAFVDALERPVRHQRNPAWLWYSTRWNRASFGRQPREGEYQSTSYIRTDLVVEAIREAGAR